MPVNDFTESHRSFINAWEMDENAHMNVQFYYRRFDEAARFFAMLSAGAPHDGPPPRDRHVRYHRELLAASTTRIRSAMIADGEHAGRVAHILEHAETGALCATALDAPTGLAYRHRVAEGSVLSALPRSIVAAPLEPLSPDRICAQNGLVANRSIAGTGECGPDGVMREQFLVARLSDSAPHAWARTGVDVEWLRARNLGRVAVEMKLTHHAPARAGDPLVVYSASGYSSGKTVRLRHEIVRMPDMEAVASAEVVALILDLSTRKPQRLPEELVERLNEEAV